MLVILFTVVFVELVTNVPPYTQSKLSTNVPKGEPHTNVLPGDVLLGIYVEFTQNLFVVWPMNVPLTLVNDVTVV